jgi:Flp pilus assembly protein TadD
VRKALEALAPVATQSTATSEILGLYGKALTLAGQPDEAEQAFSQAAERYPTDPEVLPQLAAVAQRLGHFDAARQALVRYSALVDDDADKAAHAARIGDLSLQLDDATAAVKWYEKAETLTPPDVFLLSRLADAQAKVGRLEDAQATISRALAKDPSNVQVQTIARRLQVR